MTTAGASTNVAMKVMEMSAWRWKLWGDLGKHPQRMQTWHVARHIQCTVYVCAWNL